MALFSVQRYLGDDESDETTEQASDILKKINKEALKRKRAKLGQEDTKTDDVESQETGERSQKKKKRKLSNQKIAENDSDSIIKEKGKAKLKLKERDKHGIEEELNNDTNGEKPDLMDKETEYSRTEGMKNDDNSDVTGNKNIDRTEDKDDTGMDTKGKTEVAHRSEFGGQLRTEMGGFTVIGDVRKRKQEKVYRVLPEWLEHPSVISEDIRKKRVELTDIEGFDNDMVDRLKENGISYFFPVQAQVIPILLSGVQNGNLTGRGGYRPSDICCSAPTGSGKTLAFVLPIVQALKHRMACQVRALAVLPVGDLATQVYNVFCTYCRGTKLKVGLITGQKTFSNEQKSLVRVGVRGYHSQVDIIIATPGRLVDHINQTQGFDLSHLRFLIIDEADRVMDEIKQDWLAQVENAVFSAKPSKLIERMVRPVPGPYTAARAAKMEMPLQKLLFSATLSQNPEKLQQLNLFLPKLFTSVVQKTNIPKCSFSNDDLGKDVDSKSSIREKEVLKKEESNERKGEFIGKFTTPAGLTEYYIETDKGAKPLMVLHLLHQLKFKGILCFTNSLEDTHRLYLLVKLYGGVTVEEFSSRLHATRRARILKKFSSGNIDLLICSDSMARGMDVENAQCVISYEPPPYLKTYIHRIGRTARAGKTGTAFTLLEAKEIFHFKKMIKEAGKERVNKLKISKSELKPLVEKYQTTLQELPGAIKAEKFSKKRKR